MVTDEKLPSLTAQFTEVPHLVRRLRAMDARINDLLALFRTDPNDLDRNDDIAELIWDADDLRHELTTDSPRMPDEHHDFLVAHLQYWLARGETDNPDEEVGT